MSKFKIGQKVKHILSGERLLIIKPLKKDRYLVQRCYMEKEQYIYELNEAREIELINAA